MSWYALICVRGSGSSSTGSRSLCRRAFEVAHATILSAYSRELAHGSES